MKKGAMNLLAFALMFILIKPVYAQTNKNLCKEDSQPVCSLDKSVKDYLRNERYNSDSPPPKNKFSIIKLFKSKAFAETQNIDEERKKIREEWKELLGLDVFYPYFKAQEVENYVQKKATVKFFNMHGKPEFNKESKGVKYIFKSKF
ncbi:MAG: hypothetical protein NTY14_04345 [Candidatus Omnitrophica bacterium]|nr:hypothetical protein [Candidatus Omnitrophota bacterium]